MSMGFMVAAASRGRKMENEGREMENRQREGNYGRSEGNYGRAENYGRMEDAGAEMRRRRDERGRYMEGEGAQNRMEGGNTSHYWPEPYIPPYTEEKRMRRMTEEPDGQNPYGGEPEVYRRQREGRSEMEMRRTSGKTSGGELEYNRADGGYGNVRYFMHKTDPLDQRGGEEHFKKPRQIGFQSGGKEEELDRDTVMEWVQGMEDADGVMGGKYTWHQAQQYALNVGLSDKEKQIEFYWAMNAMYADYAKVAKKFGVDKPDFYACMAKAFIEDPDAVEDKVVMYNKYIVKKE